MKISRRITFTISALFLFSVFSATAHHGTFTFDGNTIIVLEGEITAFNWTNPHSSISMVVPGGSANNQQEYTIEADGPSILGPLGVNQDSLQPGDRVFAYVSPSRMTNSQIVLGREIIKNDGAIVSLSVAYARRFERNNLPVASSLFGSWVPDQRALFEFVQASNNWKLTDSGKQSLDSYDITAPFAQTECIPATSPTVLMYPTAKVFTDNGTSINLNTDWLGANRTIYMDGRTFPDLNESSLQGYSIGQWEGTTLLVETRNFSQNPIGNMFGVASGADKILHESFTIAESGRKLVYNFTLEDPEYLAAVVIGSYEWDYRPDVTASNIACDLDAASRHLE